MAKDSPIIIIKRRNLVEIEHRKSGEILAHCQIGDDTAVERIADILSAKRLPREAAALRGLMMPARRHHALHENKPVR